MENPLSVYNAEIGIQHNEMVNDYLENGTVETSQPFSEKVSGIKSYLQSKYEVDITPMLNLWLDEGQEKMISPKEYLDQNSDSVSDYLHSRLHQVFSETESLDFSSLTEAANNYLAQIPEDENLSEDEKNIFLNLMEVFKSSSQLWGGVNDESLPYGKPWQYAASDYVGGIMGGIMGGPLGCLVGMVGSSLLYHISTY